MMVAARARICSIAEVEKVAYECFEQNEVEKFKRLDTFDADSDHVTLQMCQLNCCTPGCESQLPCQQLLHECGASPLNAHQLLYVFSGFLVFTRLIFVWQPQC
jgi:hypothetical protein